MKFLKKINKGLVLTIIVILALVVYLVEVERQREDDKTEIRGACEEFIDVTDKYLVLPEEMQTLTGEISEEAEKAYEQAKEQARIQEIQHKLYLLNELISESSDSTFVNTLITKYIKLADKLPDVEKTGAYFALAMSKSNYTENSKK